MFPVMYGLGFYIPEDNILLPQNCRLYSNIREHTSLDLIPSKRYGF
jgi:hypothetical protein